MLSQCDTAAPMVRHHAGIKPAFGVERNHSFQHHWREKMDKKQPQTYSSDPIAKMRLPPPFLEPIIETAWDAIVANTSRQKMLKLERRFFTPFPVCRLKRRRMWRLRAGLYRLEAFILGEAVLRKSGSSPSFRVLLPLKMGWPWKATHLRVHKQGPDPLYPRGKAEWIRC